MISAVLHASLMPFLPGIGDYHMKCFHLRDKPGDFWPTKIVTECQTDGYFGTSPPDNGFWQSICTQLVDNNGSASEDNSCQGEQSPTGGQKNGSLIWRRYKKDIKKGQFLTEENWHHSPWSGRKGKPWTWHFDHFKFEVQSGEKWQQALDKRCPPSSRIWPIA